MVFGSDRTPRCVKSLLARFISEHDCVNNRCRSIEYVALLVDVWLFMVLPTVFALTKSVLPISQGARLHPTYHEEWKVVKSTAMHSGHAPSCCDVICSMVG